MTTKTNAKPIIVEIIGYTAEFKAYFANGNGDVSCKPGDIIKWKVPKKIGISAISVVYSGGSHIFSEGPSQNGNGNNWQGTVSLKAGGENENYTVNVTPTGSKNAIRTDPKITVSSGGNR